MGELKGTVASVVWQSKNTFYLIIKLEHKMPFGPGKFINLTYKCVTRSYTVCNNKTSDKLELFIRLKEGGEISKKFETIKVGDGVNIKGPFKEADFNAKKLLCIGGGSGTAAFIALARSVEENILNKELVIISSNKYIRETGYFDELQKMKRVKTILTLTQEKNKCCESGRLTRKMIDKYVDPSQYEIFVCGPEGFTKAVGEMLKEFKPHLMMW